MRAELTDEMIRRLFNDTVSAAEILRRQITWEHSYE
jgi:hypothetical protein